MPSIPEIFHGLTEQERALVCGLVCGLDFEPAARAAGYAESGIPSLKSRVTRKPEFQAALHVEMARRLNELAPDALETVRQVKKGLITEGAKVRLDAAKIILDRAGYIAPRARIQGDGTEKTLGEMSIEELKATQDRLQQEIEARAKTVKAQELPPSTDQASDLLG